MAIRERKTTEIKRKKPAMHVEDRDLRDALNAGKRSGRRNYTYKPGSIIPVIEPLVIDKTPRKEVKKAKVSADTYSYEKVTERTHDYAMEQSFCQYRFFTFKRGRMMYNSCKKRE